MGYICSYHALSFVRSLQCLRSTFTVRSGSAIPEPCCFLDSDRRTLAAHCFPALPASALRKAPHLPTESSVSAYGSSASALRKAPLLPTEAPPLPYGKLRLVSRCVLLPVINSLSATESSRLHCDSYKILLLAYKALNDLAPAYLTNILSGYNPTRSLRSQNSGPNSS